MERSKERSDTRAKECEAKHSEEWSVKRTRDEVSSEMTLVCFRARGTRRVVTSDEVKWPLSEVEFQPVHRFFVFKGKMISVN